MNDERPAWLRRGIVPAPERDENEQRARAVAKELGAQIAAKLEPGTKLSPAEAVNEHLGAEEVLRHARALGVLAENFRIWVMCAAMREWSEKSTATSTAGQ